MMTKIKEKNVQGGESVLLHLDDWEDCDKFFNHPVGQSDFIWGSPKSKNITYKVEHPIFSKDDKGRPQISYIDQFPEPKSSLLKISTFPFQASESDEFLSSVALT